MRDLVRCSVVLATEYGVLIRQSTHLFFCNSRNASSISGCSARQQPRRESVRTPEPRVSRVTLFVTCASQPTSSALVQRTEYPDTNSCHVTSRHDKPTSSTTCSETRNSQSRSPEGLGFKSAPLPCLPRICSVSCAQLSFTLEPDNGLCNT